MKVQRSFNLKKLRVSFDAWGGEETHAENTERVVSPKGNLNPVLTCKSY